MEGALQSQAECESEQRKLREVQDAIKQIGERQKHDESARLDTDFETKEISVRKERKEKALELAQHKRARQIEEADKKVADERRKLGELDAEQSQHAKALEEHEAEMRALNDTLYRSRMEFDADAVRVQQQQQQLTAQVRAYHQDLLEAMRQVSASQHRLHQPEPVATA